MKDKKLDIEERRIICEFYFENPGVCYAHEPEIIELSEILIDISDVPIKERTPGFRSPSAIAIRIGNFKAIDDSYSGTGLTHYANDDAKVFSEFSNRENKEERMARRKRQIERKEMKKTERKKEQKTINNILKEKPEDRPDFKNYLFGIRLY